MPSPLFPLVLLAAVALGACGSDHGAAPEPAPPASERTEGLPSPDATPDTTAWTAGVVHIEGDAQGSARLRDVRAGAHPDAAAPHDRVVFEFEGGALPGVRVAYVDSPVRACGSGDVVPLDGDNHLEIRLAPAVGHTETGEATVPDALAFPDSPNVTGGRRTCDFEGVVTWALGIEAPNRVRVQTLRQPARVVVDVRR